MGLADWDAFRTASLAWRTDARILRVLLDIVEGSDRPAVVDGLYLGRALDAARVLANSAIYQMSLLTTRAFSAVRHSKDRHMRVGIQFLRQPGRLEGRTNFTANSDLLWSVDQFTKMEGDPRLRGLARMRNKVLAHWAEMEPGAVWPNFFDIAEVVRTTAAIGEKLASGCGGEDTDGYDLIQYRKSVEAFWLPWERQGARVAHLRRPSS